MMFTPEIDIYAPEAHDIESASEQIDGSIGQGSLFHDQFGYYGDGVSPATAKMPTDWNDRAVEYSGAECPVNKFDQGEIEKLAKGWKG